MVSAEWDTALSFVSTHADKRKNSVLCRLPAPVSHAIIERGYNRAKVRVTPDGVLILPYSGGKHPRRESVELPDWGRS